MEAGVFIPWKGWTAVKTLGQGGFGKVYEIHRTKGGVTEKAAMKVITIPKDTSEVEYLEAAGYDEASITGRFDSYKENVLREYGIMAKMKGNTNIVYCDDVEEIRRENAHGWNIYIKMELLTPLLKAMDSVQEEAQIIRLGKDLCGALIACQKHSIIHRDIKPQNVFVSPDGTFKLGDFGIARTLEHTTRATAGIGTYNYMAPEVLHKKAYNQTVDIYSLGLMLYWLLNARRGPFMPLPPAPMTHSAEEEAFRRRMSGEAVPAPVAGSPGFKRIVLKACAFDPGQRYQTAEAMLRDLEALSGKNDLHRDRTVAEDKTVCDAAAAGKKESTPYRNAGVGRVENVPKQPPRQPETVLESQPYRNAGKGNVEYVKQPPKADPKPKTPPQPPKSDPKPKTPPQQPKATPKPQTPPQPSKAKPKKKAKSLFVWLILLALGFIGVLVNSPELQAKLGISMTQSREETVILSPDAAAPYEGAVGATLEEVFASGVCEHMGFTDGSHLLMYYDEYDRERIRVYHDGDGTVAAHFEAEYDADGNMLCYRTFEGQTLVQTIVWNYNDLGKEASWQKTDGSGMLKEQAVFTYDADGFLQDVLCTDAAGDIVFTTVYSYSPDGMGSTAVRTDRDGFIRIWNDNALDQCYEFRYEDAAGNQQFRTEYTYDGEGHCVLEVNYDSQNAESYRAENVYDAQGRLSRVYQTWTDGSKTEYGYFYDSRGNVEKQSVLRTYSYDQEVHSEKATIEEATDMRDNVLRSIDSGNDGSRTVLHYTVFGEQAAYERYNKAGGLECRMDYALDANGEIFRIYATYYYDGGGRSEAVMNAQWEEISSTSYDAQGNKTEWTEATLDEQGRILEKQTCRADGSISSINLYRYLEDGTLEGIAHTYFHEDGSATETLYDANWNPQYKNTMDATGITNEVFYTYGADGALESMKDITYWDDRSYTVSMSDGDYNLLTRETYDANDSFLNREEYQYDDQGRKHLVIYTDFEGTVFRDEYIYDGDGNLQDVIRHEG